MTTRHLFSLLWISIQIEVVESGFGECIEDMAETGRFLKLQIKLSE